MNVKPWVRTYLFLVGSIALTLGIILVSRNLLEHRSLYPGLFLGVAFVIYGILRLRQAKQFPVQR